MLSTEFANSYRGKRSENTVVQYRIGARKFEEYLSDQGRNVHQLRSWDFEEFVGWMIKQDFKPRTITVHSGTAARFCSWLKKNNVKVPEISKPVLPKIHKERIEILPDELIPQYMSACYELTDEPYTTSVLLLPFTGLRVTEMCTLEQGMVQLVPPSNETPYGAAQLHVVGKGNKYRPVPVLSEGVSILANYIGNVRDTLPNCKWMFPNPRSHRKNPITRGQVWTKINEIKLYLGLPRLHPHLLRHTYGTVLNENGVTDFDLAQIMGHSDVKTTSIYVHPVKGRLLKQVSGLSYKGNT